MEVYYCSSSSGKKRNVLRSAIKTKFIAKKKESYTPTVIYAAMACESAYAYVQMHQDGKYIASFEKEIPSSFLMTQNQLFFSHLLVVLIIYSTSCN